jgi:hypothetical protein
VVPVLAASLLAASAWAPGAAGQTSAQPGGERFASPQAAAQALDSAWLSDSAAATVKVFGPGGERVASSGDPVAEAMARKRMAGAYAQRHRLEPDGAARYHLVIGAEDWPYPIPIVRQAGSWVFDVAAGEQQILDRRVGRNEMQAIETCRAYVTAQREFAASRPGGARDYALRVQSSPGAHDGLYWPARPGEPESPLGERVAAAEAQGYGLASREGTAPFRGYYFRILTAQGRSAPGGARNYLKDGRMTGGFAMVAWPDRWGDSGIMTFVVSQSGIVFEKNLGPDTVAVAKAMTTFDPDRTWRVVKRHVAPAPSPAGSAARKPA